MAGRRLSVRDIVPDDATLDLTGWPDIPREWQVELQVRGRLTVPEISELFALEAEIKAAEGDDVEKPLRRAYETVMGIIREKYPELPDLPLGIDETMTIMAWLSGADTVADAVRDAITVEPELDEDGRVVGDEIGRDGDAGTGESGAPLPSKKPSSRRSSASASGSGGDPSGGETAPGVPSEATSDTSKVAA